MNENNPHHLCTWEKNAPCGTCSQKSTLHCKWDGKALAAFLMAFLPFAFCSFFGLYVLWEISGSWWPLATYGAFCILFFTVIETRILCSHCPFYAKEGMILHCLANHGFPKFWKYHPEPMNRFEKVSLVICFLLLGFSPVFANFYGAIFLLIQDHSYDKIALLGMIGLAIATLFTILAFFTFLQVYVCPKCVNFSCPFNKVDEPDIEDYLARNPVMKKAWQEKSW